MPGIVEIQAPTRVHLGLFEMGQGGYRHNGGIGFAIKSPQIAITARAEERLVAVTDLRRYGSTDDDKRRLLLALETALKNYELTRPVHITIDGEAHSHCGFGTGSLITLASLEALFLANGRQPDHATLIALSLRGGTSGVGIRTYFEGGLCLDVGHRAPRVPTPSSDHTRSDPARSIARAPMPAWGVLVALPSTFTPISKARERAFFSSTIPVSRASVLRVCYDAILGLYPAILEANFEVACQALTSMQRSEWKDGEWKLHGPEALKLRESLESIGAGAVALSSLGPLVMALFPNEAAATSAASTLSCQYWVGTPTNCGRTIRVDGVAI